MLPPTLAAYSPVMSLAVRRRALEILLESPRALGAYEVLWGDVPEAVALDEAVTLARELSTDDSPAFVNGLLARIAGQRSTLDLEA